MMYEIKMLALSFNYYKSIDVDEARELMIIAVNEFVDAVNADERIHPYLFNYPFEPKNVEISIVVRNPDGSKREDGKLCMISFINGILKYKTNDPDYIVFKTLHKETYEEALQKISENECLKENEAIKSA